MKTILSALTLAASLATAAPALAETDPAATTFEGYLRFSGQEFHLIEDRNQYATGRPRPCVSGALPRDLQRQAAGDVGGQRVRITGTTMTWSEDLPGHRYTHQGSNIRNECGADEVILATDLAVIP